MAIVTNNVYYSATYTLNLQFNNNGGGTVPATASNSTTSSASSVKVTTKIPSTVPERSGYTFLGWATSANGEVEYQPGASIIKWFSRSATLDHTIRDSPGDGNTYVYNYYNCSNKAATNTYYAIWEATGSTVSTTDGTLGVQQTLTITPLDPSYLHTLKYAFAGQTGTIASNVATTATWTPPLSLAEYLTDAASAACTIYCESYDSGVLVGTTQTTITLSVPSNVKCTIASVTLAETVAGLNAKFHAFVQNKSQISVTGVFNSGTGSPAYGATVQSVSITINGQTLTSNGAVTNLLSQSGTNSYTLTITDSRGRTDSYTSTFNVLAYNAPSVSATAERDATTPSTINVSYGWTISACSDLNDKAITITYAIVGGAETDITITPATYSGSDTYAITSTDISEPYDITVAVTDFFTEVTNSTTIAAAGSRVAHVSATDKTIAFHGANPEDGSDHEFFKLVFHNGIGGVLLTDLGEAETIQSGSTKSYTLTNSSRHVFFVIGAASNNICMLLVGVTTSGSVISKMIGTASNITVTDSTNTLNIKSSNYTAFVLHLTLYNP